MKSLAGTLAAPFPSLPAVFRGDQIPRYDVARDGRVWSRISGKVLKPWLVSGGYLVVSLRIDGKTIDAPIHHLVAEAFIGPRPVGADVCHGDGNPSNNDVENLRYASRSENLADRDLHGTSQRGERNPAAKLTDEQAEQIRLRRKSGESLNLIAAAFRVAASCVSRIANGKRRAA